MVQKSPANSKAKIFVGNTFTKAFEHRIADTSNLNAPRGLPGVVTSAFAEIYDTTTGAYLPIGGAGVFSEAATITPQSGQVGTIVSYTVSPTFTATEGDYALLITYEYEDDQVFTLKYKYRVIGRR